MADEACTKTRYHRRFAAKTATAFEGEAFSDADAGHLAARESAYSPQQPERARMLVGDSVALYVGLCMVTIRWNMIREV